VGKKVIPVIIGATGTISKTFRKRPEQRSGKERSRGTTKNSHGWLYTRLYKRQLYLEHHTQYGKYCNVKLEA